MENISTDTQSQRIRDDDAAYWIGIDRTKMELSGDPMRYHSDADLCDAVGVGESYIRLIKFRVRRRLGNGV